MRSRFVIVAAMLAAVAACEDDDRRGGVINPTGPGITADISVSPASLTVGQDSTKKITATLVDASGKTISNSQISFSSADTTIATVSSTGVVRGIRGGTTTIRVSTTSPAMIEKTVNVTVNANPATVVQITPDQLNLFPNDKFKLDALVLDATGDTLYCNQCANPIISADKKDTTFRVLRDVRFSIVPATPGDTVAGKVPRVASVSSSGEVTAKDTGTALVVMRVGADNKADTTRLTVTLRPVSTVTVTPASATMKVGETLQLTATLKGANGETLSGRTITWSSSNPLLATVDTNGLVTAQAPSLNTAVVITATAEGQSGSSRILVDQ